MIGGTGTINTMIYMRGNPHDYDQVLISQTIYKQIFDTKVFCEAFMCLKFGFVKFW